MSADARASPGSSDETPEDVFLEDLRGERSMSWVESENARALASVVGPGVVEDDPMYARLRAIYDDKNKIPSVRLRGSFVYNFWQDETHVKGIWRRTTMDDFKTSAPTWETVLDVDALAAEESVSWVWKGPVFLDYGPGQETRKDRCVVKLSDGGGEGPGRRRRPPRRAERPRAERRRERGSPTRKGRRRRSDAQERILLKTLARRPVCPRRRWFTREYDARSLTLVAIGRA